MPQDRNGLDADELEALGFVRDGDVGLYYQLGAAGAVRRFGLVRRGEAPGEETGREVEILETPVDGVTAVHRDWTQSIHPHPDGDPEVTLSAWAADMRRTMLETYHHTLVCSFCGKTQAEVARLIAGPSAYICNECAVLVHEIVTTES